MKRKWIMLIFLVLMTAAFACKSFGLAVPTPQPTYTPNPTYTAIPKPTATLIPGAFTIEFHMFDDFVGEKAFLKVANTGETALQPKALQLSNPATSEVYIEIENPEFGDESKAIEPGNTKSIEVELGQYDEVGTEYVASLTLCDEKGACVQEESNPFEYRQNLDFELKFLEAHLCDDGSHYAVFMVTNTGNWLLQNANILVESVADDEIITQYSTDEPFLFDWCPESEEGGLSILRRFLPVDGTRNIAVKLGEPEPGTEMQVTIDLCTWDQDCKSKSTEFSFLGEPSFDATYMGRHPCEDAPNAASFAITNTGMRAFESSQIIIMDPSGEVISQNAGDPGFVAAEDACPPGDSALSPGQAAYLSADIGGTELGPQFQATIELCTQADLEGRCASQTLSFVENLTFDVQFAGTHVCTEDGVFDHTYAAFEITNTSKWPFESKFIRVFDLANGERLGEPLSPDQAQKRNNAPFVGEEGCYPGDPVLESGQTSYMIYFLYDAEPGDYEAQVQLCTEDGVKGACMEQTINFTYQE